MKSHRSTHPLLFLLGPALLSAFNLLACGSRLKSASDGRTPSASQAATFIEQAPANPATPTPVDPEKPLQAGDEVSMPPMDLKDLSLEFKLFTEEEVQVWRQRSTAGPYKEPGDAQKNSPGDYARIKQNADAFRAKPAGDRWNGGYQGKGCVPRGATSDIMAYEPKDRGDQLRDAAFVALLQNDKALAQLVSQELLRYATDPLLNFSDQKRWCLGDESVRDSNPGFFIAEWLSKMLYSYQYVREAMPSDQQATFEQWLHNAALYFQKVNDDPTEELFKDHKKGILKQPQAWSAAYGRTHEGGYTIPKLASHYNNRRASIARFVAQAGLMTKDAVLIDSARQFFVDWMVYGIFPDGTMNEYYRGSKDKAETGYHYSVITITLMLEIADIFARQGDASLYDFSTSAGIGETAGGPKNLHRVLTRICNMIDGTVKLYLPGFGGNETYRLDGIDPNQGNREFVFDIWFATANLYYRDSYITSVYLRKAPGTHAYPAEPANAGYSHPWSGTHGTMPGSLFMRGQLESQVWPYPLPKP